jgi:hypothetical protein
MVGFKDPKPGLAPGFVFCADAACADIHAASPYTRVVPAARWQPMRKTIAILLASSCAAGNAFAAVSCPTPQRPVQPAGIAPVAAELASATAPLGTPGSVLAQAYDDAQSLDQVLLRIRIEACRDVAIATPAPAVLSPEDPAAYKPRTQYDNTPWRFNMNQNGRNMTADEFSAWMQSRGVRVARGAATAPAAAAPAASGTPAPDVVPPSD